MLQSAIQFVWWIKNWWKNIEIAAVYKTQDHHYTTYFLFRFSLEMKSKQIWIENFSLLYLDSLGYRDPLPIHREQRRVLTNSTVTWMDFKQGWHKFLSTWIISFQMNPDIVKPRPRSKSPKAQPKPSQIQSKSVPKGLGLTLKSLSKTLLKGLKGIKWFR